MRPGANNIRLPGPAAVARNGFWQANKWLILRRASQLFFLALFLTGPLFGLWIAKGSLTSSLTLNILPLTDPFFALQALLAHHALEGKAIIGALIVLAAYALIGGRMYCSWVCPVNLVTDAAAWLRARLDLPEGVALNRSTRLWILGAVLVVSALTGTAAWEFVNPIAILHRGLVFGALYGAGLVWIVVAALFLFDLAVSSRGWCGRLCPVGAFYAVLGTKSLLRVRAADRDKCDDCLDCYKACPEAHVISPALKGSGRGIGPVILSGDCTNCGRCIDVCPERVFEFGPRWKNFEKHAAVSDSDPDKAAKAAA